ncbi:MAG: sulfatase [Lentisphaerae bacterium]|nr:sulfatase [Lentisphaerota bacterium]
MNILLIHSHDTGRYIQPYGHAVATPNLQRLAEQGVIFRQAFSAAPTCSPSRAAMETGQWPHSCGMLGLSHCGFALDDFRKHWVHTLRQNGFYCALSGVQHVDGPSADIASYGRNLGYDAILNLADMRERWDDLAAEFRAAEFLRRGPREPFFLSVGFTNTHQPYGRPGPDDPPAHVLPPPFLPDTPEVRFEVAGFHTAARQMDRRIGVVLDALQIAGLETRTLVIYTTDHGLGLPGAKCTLSDHGLGVALLMRGPAGAGLCGGRACDALISHVDLFPTLCDLLGIPPPPHMQGRSFLPVLRGERPEIREELFGEVTYHAAYEPMRCVRTRRWKYIRRFTDRDRPVLPNCDGKESRAFLLAHGLADRYVPREQLFDLFHDPMERENLAECSAHAAVLADLRGRLDRWMRETRDPLLDGPVPLPPEGFANSPDQQSSHDPLMVFGSALQARPVQRR